jgi:hypothetical protein
VLRLLEEASLLEPESLGSPMHHAHSVTKIVRENIARESRLHTDERKLYGDVSAHFVEHMTVKHSAGEYVRGGVHTNTIEGYFSIFKRGMRGVYQHCAEKHLHRYLAEFDSRYNNRIAVGVSDKARAAIALKGLKASASPIDVLTEPSFEAQAKRFLRWRKKNRKQRR